MKGIDAVQQSKFKTTTQNVLFKLNGKLEMDSFQANFQNQNKHLI